MIQSSLRWEKNTERSTVVILSPLLVKQPVSEGQRSSQQAGQLHPLLLPSVRPPSCPLSVLLSWLEVTHDARSDRESAEFPSERTGQEGSPVQCTCSACVYMRVVGCQLVLVHVAIFDSVSAVHLRSAHSVTWHWLRATLEICCLSAIAPLPFPLTPPPHPLAPTPTHSSTNAPLSNFPDLVGKITPLLSLVSPAPLPAHTIHSSPPAPRRSAGGKCWLGLLWEFR